MIAPASRIHPQGCRCSGCTPPAMRAPETPRVARLLLGFATGIVLVLILAAAGAPSPLVIIGK